jgi:hypothetical protein
VTCPARAARSRAFSCREMSWPFVDLRFPLGAAAAAVLSVMPQGETLSPGSRSPSVSRPRFASLWLHDVLREASDCLPNIATSSQVKIWTPRSDGESHSSASVFFNLDSLSLLGLSLSLCGLSLVLRQLCDSVLNSVRRYGLEQGLGPVIG